MAELLRHGIVDETGRILAAEELSSGEPIYLWQKEIRELQLAAGVIRAGLNILLLRAGLEPDDLEAVLLAGAFGNTSTSRTSSACP